MSCSWSASGPRAGRTRSTCGGWRTVRTFSCSTSSAPARSPPGWPSCTCACPSTRCGTSALRDVVGSGEGIFGICDAWPDSFAEPLAALERQAIDWRWWLRSRTGRLSRIHGDFHPYNILFREGDDFTALDASRGGAGDPADDLAALAVNYVFFAADHPERWASCFAPLWRLFWSTYLERSSDHELCECVGPYLAWRALVVGCPRFYPQLSPRARERLLALARLALASPRFEPDRAAELFR
ncbi:MAG: aminoglycoside phosphotransferase family protein [Archangiaceae bacterium]|nr:aminoglycoside phosphotransferase family protein [Archangiaceae bacterium]